MDQSSTNTPTVLIAFGATGDLMARYGYPAIHNLHTAKMLPDTFSLLGYSRRDLGTDGFRTHVKEALGKKQLTPTDDFLQFVDYQQGTFDAAEDYQALAQRLNTIQQEADADCMNRLFYLAVPPKFYPNIFEHLAASGLVEACGEQDGGWTRVIVEKPFGNDLATAKTLDKELGKLFREEQIFRIDHYLGKEILQNILIFRFSNNLFEHNWDADLIESIHIRFLETLDIQDRGGFYDDVGALRDVGQNHLLQMLALTTMDQPLSFHAHDVRASRAELLAQLPMLSTDKINTRTVRGQYDGFRQSAEVKDNTQTETYFRVEFELDSPRWKDVPIVLESGKNMPEVNKEIEVTFRHPKPCLCPPGQHLKNSVVFSFEPEQITIRFWSKQPGYETMQLEERTFDFLLRKDREDVPVVGAYQKLLLDAIRGDQLLFVSTDEIQAMWRFIDPILEAWHAGDVPLETYAPKTIPGESNRDTTL